MPSLIEQLDAVDLSALTQKIQAARAAVGADGSAAVRGMDPRALLGELGGLLASENPFGIDPAELTSSVSGGLAKLDGLVQLPHLPLVGDVVSGLERLAALLEDALEKFGGGGEIDLNRLLPEISGLERFFDEALGQAFDAIQPQVPGELAGVLSALQTLASRNPADASELARLLGPLVLGLPLEQLDGFANRLTATIGAVDAAGGDLRPIEAEMRRIATAVHDTIAAIDVPDVVRVDVEARIAQIRGDVGLLVHNTIPGALARLAQELDALDGTRIAGEISAAVEPLLTATSAPPFRLDADLLQPVRALADNIDKLTSEDLAKHFEAVEAELTGVAGSAGVTQLTNAVDELFDIVVHTLREVPVRRMREDLIDELHVIEARIREFEGFEAPRVIAEKVAGIERRIDEIDLTAVGERVAAFAQKLQEVVNQFPVNDIKTGAEQAGQAIGSAMGEFTTALASLSKEVDAIAEKLRTVDFKQAGDAAITLIAEAREKVEAVISSDDVPDVAKAGIGVAASTLKSFDISIEISAPFNQTLDGIDVSVVTAPLDGVTARVRETLAKVTPSALVDELEQPFEQLLKEIERFRSDAIKASISHEFQRLESALDVLKPERLVAPLEAQFTKLTDAVRRAIDPAPLFAPLRALYKKLIDLIELLDLEKLLGKVAGKASGIPQLLGGRMQDVLRQRVGAASGQLNTDAADDLFQWGDFVRPLAAIAAQLRARLEKLAGAMLGQALNLLEAPVRRLVELAEAGTGFAAQVADAVEARYRTLDLFASGGAGEELLASLHELDAAVASAAFSGDVGVRVDGHVAAIHADLDVHAALDLGRESSVRASQAGAQMDAPDLGRALRRVGTHLRSLLPSGGLAGQATDALSARLDALFGAIDFSAIANELDALGARIRTKLEGFAKQIAAAILRLVDRAFQAVLPITPFGMLARVNEGMKRVRAEFAVLDPAGLEQEVRGLVDALVDGLEMFSPAHLASQLNGLTDGVLKKIRALDPAALLGDLTLIDGVIDTFAALRPSVVLAPLIASSKDLTDTLEAILAIDLGASLKAAIESLRAQLEAVVAQVQAEFTGLITFLEEQGGGAGASVSL